MPCWLSGYKSHIPGDLLFWVGVHSPFAPSECCDVHESAVVQETLLGTALWRFLLLLLLYFGCLRFNLTGSGERSVNFAHVDSVL